MDQNKHTFQFEKLTVDWIRLKFQNLDNITRIKLADYLCNIKFSSCQKCAKLVKESIFTSSNSKFQVLFMNKERY